MGVDQEFDVSEWTLLQEGLLSLEKSRFFCGVCP
jgi:hypothetical protein